MGKTASSRLGEAGGKKIDEKKKKVRSKASRDQSKKVPEEGEIQGYAMQP